jgi:hypothetical protein
MLLNGMRGPCCTSLKDPNLSHLESSPHSQVVFTSNIPPGLSTEDFSVKEELFGKISLNGLNYGSGNI